MSVNLVIAGQTYPFPTVGEDNWGENVTDWATAVSTQLLQRTGGTFTLTNDVNFGASFATIQAYLKSRSSNIASAGFIRLAVGDKISWRNNANSANLDLVPDASDNLTFNGTVLLAAAGSLTASRALVTNSGGDLAVSATTAAQIADLSSVASAVSGNADAATYTNKSLTDASVLFVNSSDATKKVQFALSSITTATTRIWAFPDVADTFVGLTASQTLTNKTLTSPTTTGGSFNSSPTIATPTITTGLLNGARFATVTKSADWNFAATDFEVYADASSASRTGTLLSASGNAGLTHVITYIGSDFGKIVTITDGGSFSTTLNTSGEQLTVTSDGSVWKIINRYIPSGLNAFSGAWGTTGSAPSLGNGIQLSQWQRIGNTITTIYRFKFGSTSAFGSGTFTFGYPPNMTIDSSFLPAVTDGASVIGTFGSTQSKYYAGSALYHTTGSFVSSSSGQTGLNAAGVPEAWGNGHEILVAATVPVSGWKQ